MTERAARHNACPRCLRPLSPTARFCPSCGASVAGTAGWLVTMMPLLSGAVIVVGGQLGLATFAAAVEAIGPTGVELCDGYLSTHAGVGAVFQVLVVFAGSAIAVTAGGPLGKLAALLEAVILGALAAAVALTLRGQEPWLYTVVNSAVLLASSLLGATIGLPVYFRARRLPPFSWAAGTMSSSKSRWHFVLVVGVLLAWWLLAPWAVLGVFLGAAFFKGLRAVVRDHRSHQVAS